LVGSNGKVITHILIAKSGRHNPTRRTIISCTTELLINIWEKRVRTY
jgi:hypothetical protein